MRLQPIVYAASMEQAVRWYEAVLGCPPAFRSAAWSAFEVGDAVLGIHLGVRDAPAGPVVLSLVATSPLDEVLARLAAAGITPEGGVVEQPFGRSVLLRDPGGLAVQVNEHRD
jgi:hypothetical protein